MEQILMLAFNIALLLAWYKAPKTLRTYDNIAVWMFSSLANQLILYLYYANFHFLSIANSVFATVILAIGRLLAYPLLILACANLVAASASLLKKALWTLLAFLALLGVEWLEVWSGMLRYEAAWEPWTSWMRCGAALLVGIGFVKWFRSLVQKEVRL